MTRKKSKRLKFNIKKQQVMNNNQPQAIYENPNPGVREIVKRNWKFLLLLIAITIGVYANSLPGQFSIVDDIPGIITSGRYDNLIENLKTFHIQSVIYSLLLNSFGDNPLVFHIFSLSMQLMLVVMAFILIRLLWDQRIAQIAAVIFATHPVNTESVTWISGSTYLINGMFLLPAMISYLVFKKGQKEIYLIVSIIIYTLALILTRTPWVLTLPIALVIIDQFIWEKKFNWRSLINQIYYFVPSILYILFFLRQAGAARLASRESGSYLNQQTLPRLQSYVFTIFSMLRLYIFPKDLKIYYDGNVITNSDLIIMAVISLTFGFLIYFLILLSFL